MALQLKYSFLSNEAALLRVELARLKGLVKRSAELLGREWSPDDRDRLSFLSTLSTQDLPTSDEVTYTAPLLKGTP